MVKAKVLKWGNSLAVRIPRVLAEEARFHEGDAVELTAGAEGKLEVRRALKVPSLSALVARITPENRHGEFLGDSDIGRESVEW